MIRAVASRFLRHVCCGAILVLATFIAPVQANAADISVLAKLLDRYPAHAKLPPRAMAAARELSSELGKRVQEAAFNAAACGLTHRGTVAYEKLGCARFDDFTRGPAFDPNRPLVAGTPAPFVLRPGFRLRVVATPPPLVVR